MKVTISVDGRFWLFDLAREVESRGHLRRMITPYPTFIAKRFGVPPHKVSSVLSKELLWRTWHKLPYFIRREKSLDFPLSDYFDRMASRRIPRDTDIFVGLSNSALHSIRRAKSMGMLTVLEHGSSHAEYQRDILNEEYTRFGLPLPIADERHIVKEKQEYIEADYIALPSTFAIRTFVDKGIPSEKILHCPFGADIGMFRQIPKEDDRFRAIFAGGLSLRKGVHYLLQAWHELNLPNAELLLVGTINPEIKPFLEKYRSNVRAIGAVPQAELHRYYSQGSVFILPSIEEGLAMVQPQAMACGLPVIATTNTGGEDIIRDGVDGFIIPIRDIEGLKEKILYMYEHPEECRSMGQSAKARVASGFTWSDYGERMVGEYRRISQVR